MAILSRSFRSSVIFVVGCRDKREVFCVCRDVNAGKDKQIKFRGVAQPGSAHRSGRWGRRFKSFRPDHFLFFLPLPKGFLKVTGSRCLPSRGRGYCPAVFLEVLNMNPDSTGPVTDSVIVTGRVQGVGFRAYVQHFAKRMHLSGFVENRPDGSVYLEVTGSESEVDSLVRLVKKGPPASEVSGVERKRLSSGVPHRGPFEIRRS